MREENKKKEKNENDFLLVICIEKCEKMILLNDNFIFKINIFISNHVCRHK